MIGTAVLVVASIHGDDAYGVTMTEALAAHDVTVVADAGAAVAPIAVIAEQDGADAAIALAQADPRVVALVLLSPRPSVPLSFGRPVAVLAIASKEDRHGLRGAVDAYLAGATDGSRLEVGDGLGFGATMFAARAFEQPDEERFESLIARWVAERLVAAAPQSGSR